MDISTIGQPKRRRSSTVPEQSAINQSDRNSHRDINSNNGVYNRSEFEDKGENTMSNWDYESRFSTASGPPQTAAAKDSVAETVFRLHWFLNGLICADESHHGKALIPQDS